MVAALWVVVFALMLPNNTFWLFVLCSFIGGLGVKSLNFAKKKFALSAAELNAKDDRAPVIYLRSFNDDEQFKSNNGSGLHFDNKQTFEQSLVTELRQYGPVYAIGRPGEPLPPLGAARMYVRETDWKNRVQQLIGTSRLIVVVLGKTEGLGWEISTISKLGIWDKTIIVFPPVGVADLQDRWAVLRKQLLEQQIEIPDETPSMALFGTRDSDGTLLLHESKKIKRKKKKAKYYWKTYREVLRKVLSSFNLSPNL